MTYLNRNFLIGEIKRMKQVKTGETTFVNVRGGMKPLEDAPDHNLYYYYLRLKKAQYSGQEVVNAKS